MSERLFEAFERLSIDDKLHFFLTTSKGEKLQVCYDRKVPKSWGLWLDDHPKATKRVVSRQKLSEVLQAMGASVFDLEAEVSNHLLLQCAYCDHFIREVTELMGQKAVQKSILGTQQMMDELSQLVTQTIARSGTGEDSFENIKESAPKPQRSKLVLVRKKQD